MTITVPAPNTIDRDQLQAELAAEGFIPTGVSRNGSSISFEFDESVDSLRLGEIVAAHVPSEVSQLDLLVVKARAVWNESDTFTVAQVQKILAGLVLLENRRR